MEWTNIEKKWHEMARRMQIDRPVKVDETVKPSVDDIRISREAKQFTAPGGVVEVGARASA